MLTEVLEKDDFHFWSYEMNVLLILKNHNFICVFK